MCMYFLEHFEEGENVWTEEAENTSSNMMDDFIQINNSLKTARRDIGGFAQTCFSN